MKLIYKHVIKFSNFFKFGNLTYFVLHYMSHRVIVCKNLVFTIFFTRKIILFVVSISCALKHKHVINAKQHF